MYKVTQNVKRKVVSVIDYNIKSDDGKDMVTLYSNAVVIPVYPAQIVEIHLDRKPVKGKEGEFTSKFVEILPLGLTRIVFE